MTALMFAAQEGHLEILNKLIQNGANTHMKNEVRHYSIITFALYCGPKHCVGLLISDGKLCH